MSKTKNYITRAKCRRIGMTNQIKRELKKHNIHFEEFYYAVLTEHMKQLHKKIIYGTSENKQIPTGLIGSLNK
jgi:uncharacterized protein YaaN involved in tellurite resistance